MNTQISLSQEKNLSFFEKHAFNIDGYTFVYIGDTYSIKDTLKANGAIYDRIFGWRSANPINDYPCVEIYVDSIYFKDPTGIYRWKNYREGDKVTEALNLVREANDKLNRDNCTSEYLGDIDTFVDINATVLYGKNFMSAHGHLNMIKLEDDNHNNIVWYTTKDVHRGEKLHLVNCQIKKLEEYKGVKTTTIGGRYVKIVSTSN